MIDTHAHIYLKEFKDQDALIQQAKSKGIERIYMPNINSETLDDMLELQERYPNYAYAMFGLHPCYVKKDFDKELYIIEDYLKKHADKCVAIGEIGIDLYWDKTTLARQMDAFKIQMDWAKAYKRPIVMHIRNSMKQVLAILEQVHDEHLWGIAHCFTGSAKQAKRLLKLEGLSVGIGGVITYKGGLDTVVKDIPLERIVLETDSPYLAPEPHKGEQNTPAYLPIVAKALAKAKDLSTQEVISQTSKNAISIFKN